MIKKLFAVISSLCFVSILVCIMFIFIFNHNLTPKLIKEFNAVQIDSSDESFDYFFIKDDKYNGFYDGINRLKNYLPDFDKTTLDLDRFTYVVAVNGKINQITYSGRKCKRRTVLIFPDIYTAITDYEKTNDNVIRIYQIKKINIDCDYHS